MRVLEVFFREPTTIHFIKDISKKIGLAHTSVRNNIYDLAKRGLILKTKSKPFDGYVANRENDDFVWSKLSYNILSLKELCGNLAKELYPKTIVLFGSYSRGEDIESSDVDILIISKVRKEINFAGFEKLLKRNVRPVIIDKLSQLDENIQKKVLNGFVLYGGF